MSKMDNEFTDFSLDRFSTTEYCINTDHNSNGVDDPFYLSRDLDSNDKSSIINMDNASYWQQQIEYNDSNLDTSRSCMMNESLIMHELGVDDTPTNDNEIISIDDIAKLTEGELIQTHESYDINYDSKTDLNQFDTLYHDFSVFTPTETLPESQPCPAESSVHLFDHKFHMSNNESCYQSNEYLNTVSQSLDRWARPSKTAGCSIDVQHQFDDAKKLSAPLSFLNPINSDNVDNVDGLYLDINASNTVATEYTHSNQPSGKSFDPITLLNRVRLSDTNAQAALAQVFNEVHEQKQSLDNVLNSLFDNTMGFDGNLEVDHFKFPYISDVLLNAIISYSIRTDKHDILSVLLSYAIANKASLHDHLISNVVDILLKSLRYSDAYKLLEYSYNDEVKLENYLNGNFMHIFNMCKKFNSNPRLNLELYQYLLKCNEDKDVLYDIVDIIDGMIESDPHLVLNSSTISIVIRFFVDRGDWTKISTYLKVFLASSNTCRDDLIDIIDLLLETNNAQIQSIVQQISESASFDLMILLYIFIFLHMKNKYNIIHMIYADAIDKQFQKIPSEIRSVLANLTVPTFCFDFAPQYISNLLKSILKIFETSGSKLAGPFHSSPGISSQKSSSQKSSSQSKLLFKSSKDGENGEDVDDLLISDLRLMSLGSNDEFPRVKSLLFSDSFFSRIVPQLSNENIFCMIQLSIAAFDIDSIDRICECVSLSDNNDLIILGMVNNALVNYGHVEKSMAMLKRAEKLINNIRVKLYKYESALQPFASPSAKASDIGPAGMKKDSFSFGANYSGSHMPLIVSDISWISSVSKALNGSFSSGSAVASPSTTNNPSESDSTSLLYFISSLYTHPFIVSIVLKKFTLANNILNIMLKSKLLINNAMIDAICHVLNSICCVNQLRQLLLITNLLQYHMSNDLFSAILDACIRIHSPDHILETVNRYKKLGFHPDLQTFGLLIKFFSSSDNAMECFHLWNEMTALYGYELNEVTYGCMFDALVSNNMLDEALNLLKDMKKNSNIKPNTIIYSTLIKGFGQTKQLNKALNIYLTMLDEGVVPNTITYNSIIDACARVGNMNKAASLLEDMLNNNIEPDLITFSTIIKGYCVQSNIDRSLQLLRAMSERGIKPDGILYNSILDGCVKSGRPWLCQKLWDEMQENGIAPSNFTLTILIKMYGRLGQLDKAFQLMEELPSKYNIQANTHVYTCLMSACISNGKYKMALDVFNCMNGNGVVPDSKTYETIIFGAIKGRLLYQVIDIIKSACELMNQGNGPNGRMNRSILKIESRILKLFAQKTEASGDPMLLQQAQSLAEMLKKFNVILPIRNTLAKNPQIKVNRTDNCDSFLLKNVAQSLRNDSNRNNINNLVPNNEGYRNFSYRNKPINSFQNDDNLNDFKDEHFSAQRMHSFNNNYFRNDDRNFQKGNRSSQGRTTLKGVTWNSDLNGRMRFDNQFQMDNNQFVEASFDVNQYQMDSRQFDNSYDDHIYKSSQIPLQFNTAMIPASSSANYKNKLKF